MKQHEAMALVRDVAATTMLNELDNGSAWIYEEGHSDADIRRIEKAIKAFARKHQKPRPQGES